MRSERDSGRLLSWMLAAIVATFLIAGICVGWYLVDWVTGFF